MSIDPSLQMFIQACCSNCHISKCEGALDVKSRLSCYKYKKWQNMPGDKRTKIFAASISGEITMLESLIDGK